MAEKTFADEIDSVSFFDDLIEFPSVTDTSLNSVDCNDLADIWTHNSDELHVSDSIFSASNCASTLSAVLSVPYEDIVQLEWLSNFVEDSFSGGGLTMNKENIPVKKEKEPEPEPEPVMVPTYQFQMSSPVSVLESSSSSSSSSSCSGDNNGCKMIPLTSTNRGPQRARSKRPRPPTFNPRAAIERFSPSTLIPVPVSMESENLVESHNGPNSNSDGPEQKKRKKPKKLEAQINPEDKPQNQTQNQTGHGVRKCMHCEITKTPQWRAGPLGPKTLCNACGVRYKSGRLFPEYRPAASPTFVPCLHSNSHKKVVEMRTKCMPNDLMARLPGPEPELIPNMNPPAAGYV